MMRGYGFYNGYGMMGGGWLGLVFMLVFWAIVLVAIVLLVVWAVRTASGNRGVSSREPGGRDEAEAIARRRLAAGEITAEQYEELMKALKG